jgi:type III restriction enzyme
VQAAQKSHINLVACDTGTWEQAAMFQLEDPPHVVCYVRNDRLEFNIPYEFHDIAHVYEPDFLVRLTNGVMLVLESKGQFVEDTKMKHQAAQRWVNAVNDWGQFGRWDFMVCRDPQQLSAMLTGLVAGVAT